MDGFEVVRRLRQEKDMVRTLVFALSGYAQGQDRRRALEAGCADHLAKPVDPDVLHQLLVSCRAILPERDRCAGC
jgi:CheY-like chemotaxis protein